MPRSARRAMALAALAVLSSPSGLVPPAAEIVVVTGRRGVSRCVDLVKLAAEVDLGEAVPDPGAFRVGVRVVDGQLASRGLRAAAEASAADALASLLQILGARSAGVRIVEAMDIEPAVARKAWAYAEATSVDPLLLLLVDDAVEPVQVGEGHAGLRAALARALAWALGRPRQAL